MPILCYIVTVLQSIFWDHDKKKHGQKEDQPLTLKKHKKL